VPFGAPAFLCLLPFCAICCLVPSAVLCVCRFVPSAVLCLLPFCASAVMFYAVLCVCRFVRLPFRDLPFCMCIVVTPEMFSSFVVE
jgi:hypothetical protein